MMASEGKITSREDIHRLTNCFPGTEIKIIRQERRKVIITETGFEDPETSN